MFCLTHFISVSSQVIVTTPMEMLKIQLQDAGRLGKRKLDIFFNITTFSVIRKERPRVVLLENIHTHFVLDSIRSSRCILLLMDFSCSEEAHARDGGSRNCGDKVPDSHADHQTITEGKGYCWTL